MCNYTCNWFISLSIYKMFYRTEKQHILKHDFELKIDEIQVHNMLEWQWSKSCLPSSSGMCFTNFISNLKTSDYHCPITFKSTNHCIIAPILHHTRNFNWMNTGWRFFAYTARCTPASATACVTRKWFQPCQLTRDWLVF